jgi:hypothetical protein
MYVAPPSSRAVRAERSHSASGADTTFSACFQEKNLEAAHVPAPADNAASLCTVPPSNKKSTTARFLSFVAGVQLMTSSWPATAVRPSCCDAKRSTESCGDSSPVTTELGIVQESASADLTSSRLPDLSLSSTLAVTNRPSCPALLGSNAVVKSPIRKRLREPSRWAYLDSEARSRRNSMITFGRDAVIPRRRPISSNCRPDLESAIPAPLSSCSGAPYPQVYGLPCGPDRRAGISLT